MSGPRQELEPGDGPKPVQGCESLPSAAAAAMTPDWLALYRDGDGAAFSALVTAFQTRLVHFFYRLCWDRDRAEDLTQDLFLKLLRGAARYHEEGKLSTYVFRVATNLWIDHYRTARPQPRFSSLDQVLVEGEPTLTDSHRSDRSTPLEDAIAGEERAQLRRAIEKLTAPHRIVFELAVFQELPYSEVASVLGIPVGTVKSRMHNAVHSLKDLLAGGPFRAAVSAGTFPGTAAAPQLRRMSGA